ncbi:MAG: phage shock protein operon transcriptional activator, partial [Kordiimonadaceae bacterium]|nr:phage shock protein operon transcriptional activator [Kordiimonadaceae bacterium]
ELLQQALKDNKFNQRQAADYLSLSYHQLRHQLKKHALL